MLEKVRLCAELVLYDLKSLGIVHGVGDVVRQARFLYGVVHGEVDDIVITHGALLWEHTVVSM